MTAPKIKKQLRILIFSVIGMFGFGFALIPLYDVFCDITGLNGKDYTRTSTTETTSIDNSRIVKVEFVTYLNKQLPWKFEPEIKSIELHPGERYQVSFTATNQSNEDTFGRAVPSISPGYGAQYLVKTECFCFQEQMLMANEEAMMPLIFYIDPNIPSDISTLTLAYTLFKNEPTEVAMR
ncbi:cytochrome c oxidase assembly protein [Moritella sp. 24]|uniref:cytochrome c oxidase assembly protein n=1 Tax=Moritella sp. 24 TaxID=2746230 RepID=UPI001BACA9A9|nr:cytochrome c oxidase assembly protein [Moritella sp. 24]QUM77572.1 cytochrome c oxidase assembly protein [Moritella sp. 24]